MRGWINGCWMIDDDDDEDEDRYIIYYRGLTFHRDGALIFLYKVFNCIYCCWKSKCIGQVVKEERWKHRGDEGLTGPKHTSWSVSGCTETRVGSCCLASVKVL